MKSNAQINKARPPRLKQTYQYAPLYFVTFCTQRRQPLLANDSVHGEFRKTSQRISESGNAIGRYVIMPDHIHVFMRIAPNGRLGLTVKCVREAITKHFHGNSPGIRVWQPGFFDHLMRSAESYADKWRYVRNNPVRANFCNSADQWPYQGEIIEIRW